MDDSTRINLFKKLSGLESALILVLCLLILNLGFTIAVLIKVW